MSTEMDIIRWAEARKIIPNSTPLTQAIKTAEEVTELLKALNEGDREGVIDAYGDIMVTLIIGAALYDVDLRDCTDKAYAVIKDRKGTLTPSGLFIKE